MNSSRKIFGRIFSGMFGFSSGERKGLLILLPLLLLVGIAILVARRPAGERNLEVLADTRQSGGNYGTDSYRTNSKTHRTFSGEKKTFPSENGVFSDENRSSDHDYTDAGSHSGPSSEKLFVFDPNTVSLEDLCRLGFAKREAAGILSYRESGKVFHDQYDFAGCYQVSLEMFKHLQPYIVIGEKYRRPAWGSKAGSTGGEVGSGGAAGAKNGIASTSAAGPVGERDGERLRSTARSTFPQPAPSADTIAPFDPNTLDVDGFVALGFSPRQAEVIISYRDKAGGFKKPEDLARCYVVSDEAYNNLKPYIHIAPKPRPALVDLNRADSATLCLVDGIGPTTAGRIVALRRRLRGFASVGQLAGVEGITERNFEMMSKEIFASPDEISKIDINFATPSELEHPYIPGTMLRKILKIRQLKGGWASIEDMVKEEIMTPEQAARLAPYLIFNPPNQ